MCFVITVWKSRQFIVKIKYKVNNNSPWLMWFLIHFSRCHALLIGSFCLMVDQSDAWLYNQLAFSPIPSLNKKKYDVQKCIASFFNQWWNLKQEIITFYFPPERYCVIGWICFPDGFGDWDGLDIWKSEGNQEKGQRGEESGMQWREDMRLEIRERMLRTGFWGGRWLASGHLRRNSEMVQCCQVSI